VETDMACARIVGTDGPTSLRCYDAFSKTFQAIRVTPTHTAAPEGTPRFNSKNPESLFQQVRFQPTDSYVPERSGIPIADIPDLPALIYFHGSSTIFTQSSSLSLKIL
jgi:hypothetical protein